MSAAAELDHREVPAGILEHHRLVDHGELEVGRRVVDRDAGVLGDRDHDQRDQGEAERDPEPDVGSSMKPAIEDSWVVPASRARVKMIMQHRGLGQRGDHHLAARADAAEAGADVEPGERQEEARAAEQRHDGDQIGRPAEQQARGEGRHQRRRDPDRGEDQIGRGPEQPGRALGEHDLFAAAAA